MCVKIRDVEMIGYCQEYQYSTSVRAYYARTNESKYVKQICLKPHSSRLVYTYYLGKSYRHCEFVLRKKCWFIV